MQYMEATSTLFSSTCTKRICSNPFLPGFYISSTEEEHWKYVTLTGQIEQGNKPAQLQLMKYHGGLNLIVLYSLINR